MEMICREARMTRWTIRPLIWLKHQPEQRIMTILAIVTGLGSGPRQ